MRSYAEMFKIPADEYPPNFTIDFYLSANGNTASIPPYELHMLFNQIGDSENCPLDQPVQSQSFF